jgi:hypothetical protein
MLNNSTFSVWLLAQVNHGACSSDNKVTAIGHINPCGDLTQGSTNCGEVTRLVIWPSHLSLSQYNQTHWLPVIWNTKIYLESSNYYMLQCQGHNIGSLLAKGPEWQSQIQAFYRLMAYINILLSIFEDGHATVDPNPVTCPTRGTKDIMTAGGRGVERCREWEGFEMKQW